MSHQEPGFVSNGQRTFMNLRKANRMAVPPMYSTLAVQAKPFRGAREGHVYDLSESGLRFEIDDPLPVGTDLALEFAVPAAGVILENVVAFEVATALCDKFGNDSLHEMKSRYDLFLRMARER